MPLLHWGNKIYYFISISYRLQELPAATHLPAIIIILDAQVFVNLSNLRLWTNFLKP